MRSISSMSRMALRRFSVDHPSPALKNLPTVVVFVAAVLLSLLNDGMITVPVSVALGCVVMVIATALSFFFSSLGRVTRWALIVPGCSLLAVALLRLGTGGAQSLFSSIIILPIVWIAAEKGRRWVLVAIVGTSAALMLPFVVGWQWPSDDGEWLRGIFTPAVYGIAAAVTNELSRQGRQQLAVVERLAAEREILLQEMIRATDQLKANDASLRAADRLTRSVLDGVTEQSIIGSDLTGLIDVWNKGASVMLGLSSQETLGKRYVFDFHVDDELESRSRELNYPPGATVLNPGFSALVESARLGRAEVRDWTYVRHDGSQLSVSVAVTPRVDESGSTVGYIFVGTDVTYALEVARLKDQFVGLISHELRTPLSSILGYLELLRDDDDAPLSEEQLLYLGVAERNAHRLLRLVGDLLFTAQVSAGNFPLDISEVALVEVVSAAIDSARPAASVAGVQLLVELPPDGIFVPGDAVRLGQACDNLISNAVKFTPRGGTVTVSLSVTDSDAVVLVRDTGIGIPASELDQLYTRFFRATTATRNAVPGVGLGLAITKAIVTAHEGEINVESREGDGTAISMSIPLSRRPALI